MDDVLPIDTRPFYQEVLEKKIPFHEVNLIILNIIIKNVIKPVVKMVGYKDSLST